MASTSEETKTKKMFTLRSSDGHIFELEEAAVRMSETIRNMIEDDCAGDVIPLPNVDAATLSKVAEYCKRHTELPPSESADTLKAFDNQFIAEVKDDQHMLFDLILAANYLAINELLQLTCGCVADMMRGKNIQQIRAIFHIKNDFTPEKETEVRNENSWAFE